MPYVGDPELYKLGAQLRGDVQGPQRLSQALRDEDDLDEFYHLYGHECCYAQVWSRQGISRKERALATFSIIAALGPGSDTLRVHVRGAFRSGCSRAEIRQVVAMVTWYAGVPVGQQATSTVRAALNELPEAALYTSGRLGEGCTTGAEIAARGKELRLRVLGPQSERLRPSQAQLAHDRMVDSHYFGVLWSNTDLDLKQRCLVLLGVMCGANRLRDAEIWFGAALRLGYSPDELHEFALTAGVYCGELIYSQVLEAIEAAVAARGS